MKYTELSLKNLKEISMAEATVIGRDFPVNLIIYVARAGLPIALYMNEIFDAKLLGIGAQRKGNALKSKIAPLVAYCPRFVRDILITIELKTKIHKRNRERNIEFHKSICDLVVDNYDNILIVDDSVDTGNSMKLVYEAVQSKFPKANIKTYSLNVWNESKSVFVTDYSSYENTVIRAPMSKDSREYKIFCELYDRESENDYL